MNKLSGFPGWQYLRLIFGTAGMIGCIVVPMAGTDSGGWVDDVTGSAAEAEDTRVLYLDGMLFGISTNSGSCCWRLNGTVPGHVYEFYFAQSLSIGHPDGYFASQYDGHRFALAERGFPGTDNGIIDWYTWDEGPGRNPSMNQFYLYAGVADDSDGDGLSDGYETGLLGTSPDVVDTDTLSRPEGNGISDADEDFDGDGLSNLEEYIGTPYGGASSPKHPDTDLDGICDGPTVPEGWEHLVPGPDAFPLDPAAGIDTDGDGMPDELTGSSNSNPPLVADDDDDNDGMPDLWEIAHDLDLKDPADAADDQDQDGLTNLAEYLNQTDPGLADSDGDGLGDGFEVESDFNPLSLPGQSEIDEDIDEDGLPDSLEYLFFTNLNQSATNDFDGDGLLNNEELSFSKSNGTPIEIESSWVFDASATNVIFWTNGVEIISDRDGYTDYEPDDEGAKLLNLGFGFPFFGEIHSNAYIGVNGTISFGSPFGSYDYIVEIDSTGELSEFFPSNYPGFLAPFWCDMEVMDGQVFWQSNSSHSSSNSMVITWSGVSFYDCTNSSLTFQAELFESGDVIYRYGNMEFDEAEFQYVDAAGETNYWWYDAVSALTGSNGNDWVVWSYEEEAPGSLTNGLEVSMFPTEYSFSLNSYPHIQDSDADGLGDYEESRIYSTDAMIFDTDSDGLGDGEEVFRQNPTDPLDWDTDDDLLSDGDEVHRTVTDPLDADTDGDLMSDGWEDAYGQDPTTNSVDEAYADVDGDGLNSYEEFLQGSNPEMRDSDSDGMDDGVDVCPVEYSYVSSASTPFIVTADSYVKSWGVGNGFWNPLSETEYAAVSIEWEDSWWHGTETNESILCAGSETIYYDESSESFWVQGFLQDMIPYELYFHEDAYSQELSEEYGFSVWVIDESYDDEDVLIGRECIAVPEIEYLNPVPANCFTFDYNDLEPWESHELYAYKYSSGLYLGGDDERRVRFQFMFPNPVTNHTVKWVEYDVVNDERTNPQVQSLTVTGTNSTVVELAADSGCEVEAVIPHVVLIGDLDHNGSIGDLDEALQQAASGEPLMLPPPTEETLDSSVERCVNLYVDAIGFEEPWNEERTVIEFYGVDPGERFRLWGSPAATASIGTVFQAGEPLTLDTDEALAAEWIYSSNTYTYAAFPDRIQCVSCAATNDGYAVVELRHELADGTLYAVSLPVQVAKARLAPDFDRDGEIDEGDDLRALTNEIFRFWVNDDNDDPDSEVEGDDLPGQEESSADAHYDHNSQVDGMRDLVDFFPLKIEIDELLCDTEKYEYWIGNEGSELYLGLNYILTDLQKDDVSAYLFDPETAADFADAEVQRLGAGGNVLDDAAFLQSIQDNGTAVLLVEAWAEADPDTPLVFEVREKNYGFIAASAELQLSISSVTNMFRFKSLRGDRTDNLEEPENYPDHLTDGNDFVFIHGYNVDADSGDATHAEVFKRMYQSGFDGKFWGVSWYGDPYAPLLDTAHYHHAVVEAFSAAYGLRGFLEGFSSPPDLAAHSLGNGVVGIALNDADGTSALIRNYFALDAAMPLEAYGETNTATHMTFGNSIDVTDEDTLAIDYRTWSEYPEATWASEWYRLFDSSDARSGLTWRNRMSNAVNRVESAYNFYSSTEEVLRVDDGCDSYISSAIQPGYYSWMIQEWYKGLKGYRWWLDNSLADWVAGGSSEQCGWAFTRDPNSGNTYLAHDGRWFYDTLRPPEWVAGQLSTNAAAYKETLKTDPLFKAEPSILFTASGNSFVNSFVTEQAAHLDYTESWLDNVLVRDWLLAKGFPARTRPMGSTRSLSVDWANYNMASDDPYDNGLMLHGWPRDTEYNGLLEWFHGDYKDVAYPYVQELYKKWVQIIEE
ncbi:hypothetical protein EGM51_15315 [Verrucomicrobia bacterium S94]|nr:hypothetical protein EGM51_15315 [Verrucomicrobia bacterium S94]